MEQSQLQHDATQGPARQHCRAGPGAGWMQVQLRLHGRRVQGTSCTWQVHTHTHTHTHGATLLLPHNPQPSILDQTVLPFQTVASPRPRRPTLYHHTNSNSCQVCLPLSAPAPVPAPAPAPGKPTSRPIIEIHQHSIIIIDTHPPGPFPTWLAPSQPGPFENTHSHTHSHSHSHIHYLHHPGPRFHPCMLG